MELQIKNLGKSFSQKEVLKNLHLEVDEGNLVLIVGKNGTGKTTLLRIINRLERPDTGEILYRSEGEVGVGFKGNFYTRDLLFQRRMVLAPQTPIVFPGSVYQNAIYGVRIRRQKPEISVVQDLLERFDLIPAKDLPAQKASLGQKQKLSLVRALLIPCELYLLDEPDNNLDEPGLKTLFDLLSYLKTRRKTILVTTSCLPRLAQLNYDHIYFLEDGKLMPTAS
ncbi:MAG: ABC transporter ATP-binding protein [Candidatus Omnitrophota bacterium]